MSKDLSQGSTRAKAPNVFTLLRPYRSYLVFLIVLTVIANGSNLYLQKVIANGIDRFVGRSFDLEALVFELSIIASSIFIFTYIQSLLQTIISERVARDMRMKLAAKISELEYADIQRETPAKLLTNLTSDIDAIKNFVATAVTSVISSIFLIIGASVMLLIIDWKLASIVLLCVPIIGGAFAIIFGKVRKLFVRSQQAIDWLNKVINESILGAALIRLLHSQQVEYAKFLAANEESRTIGMSILRLFASLIPIITFTTNLATLVILTMGGYFVILGDLSIGNFIAFNNYLAILVFPIIVLGFSSNIIAQASASYGRIYEILCIKKKKPTGTFEAVGGGDITLENVRVQYGEKLALKDVSFHVKSSTRTAIIGPTAAGKTQLLYLLTGLIQPNAGRVLYGGRALTDYDQKSLHKEIGFVFQDSIIFNLTLRENIAFSTDVSDADLQKAIETAELDDFIRALPNGLDTVISERGSNLSGGQKQRIMLARALALNPSVLLLDDFTARVDLKTESRILHNVRTNYPRLTLISVTQKIAPVEDYDQIILLMEGELLKAGTHSELLQTSPEYVQIYKSQRSTETYELRSQ